jgi:hypothetical protein
MKPQAHPPEIQCDSLFPPMQHPFESGYIFRSPGCHFTYRVIGPCCRLFDREELPWPCCRLQWRGKEPSWRRIGRRFVPDLATQSCPSYSVEVVGQEYAGRSFVVTLYANKLPQPVRAWWHVKKLHAEETQPAQPQLALALKPPVV